LIQKTHSERYVHTLTYIQICTCFNVISTDKHTCIDNPLRLHPRRPVLLGHHAWRRPGPAMPARHVPGRVAAVRSRRRNDESVDGAVAGSVVGRVCRVGCCGGYLVVYLLLLLYIYSSYTCTFEVFGLGRTLSIYQL
jgi:hypothetical protein